ncbi:MAG: hypothetical protein IPH62_10095 [Ignavibacteriae bacterium]|nr:hypothetical protein [Ignavibacteriota bacterium]
MKNFRRSTVVKLLIIVSFAFTSELFSQWNFRLATEQEYSDNPFHSPIPISTFISTLDFGLEYKHESLGIGYYGNYSMFHEIADRNYFWHQLGLWNSSDNLLYGLFLEQRINSVNYEFYNYSNYNAYAKYKFLFAEINGFVSASLSLTNYSYLDDLDNLLGSVRFGFNKSFETKTTIIGGVNYNYKNYFETNLNDPLLIGDSLEQSFSSSAFTSQIYMYGRVAQSVFENTGLAIQYSQQNIVGGTAKYIRQLDYIYGDESQYFDDPTSYEGNTITAQLTQLLGEGIIFKGIYSFLQKEYPSQGVYIDPENFDSTILRNDDQSLFKLSLSKKFNLTKSFIDVSLSYLNIVNKSNSYWYKYTNSQFNISFDYQF